ncbi:phosphoadenylyl-sulfate reductase, partial [Aeromicrobium phragmitis]
MRPRRDRSELQAIAAEASTRLADASTDDVLAWVAEEFGYRTAVACSMADAVLPHVVARHLPWVDTLFLETGYHFAETIGTRDAVEAGMELTIVDVTAAQSVEQQDADHGPRLYERDPGLCCQLRK